MTAHRRRTGRRGLPGGARRRGTVAMVATAAALLTVAAAILVNSSAVGPAVGTARPHAVAVSSPSSRPTVRPPATVSPVPSTASPSASSPGSAPASPSVPATGRSVPAPVPVPGPGRRLLTLVNNLQQTIWPAVAADPVHPVEATGWELPPGASHTLVIPDHWDVRVWARTGCAFNASGTGHCVTGDCAGRFQCGSTWGQFPSTLAEFNLNSYQGMDFYDVSLVEGNNLPMYINHTGGRTPDQISPTGCAASGCTHDANATCPPVMRRTVGGVVVACLSACLAIGGDQTCCLGQWSSRAACDPAKWPVDSAAVFKKAEPFAYSYVSDDATSVFTCTGECDYRITWGVSP